MLWADVALRAVAMAASVIATLRAGTRAVYLIDHDGIGVLEGPLILPPSQDLEMLRLKRTSAANGTTDGDASTASLSSAASSSSSTVDEDASAVSLYELSQAFRHCVRLSFAPHLYDNALLQQPISKPSRYAEPYCMSAVPATRSRNSNSRSDTSNISNNNNNNNNETTSRQPNYPLEAILPKAATSLIPKFSFTFPKRGGWVSTQFQELQMIVENVDKTLRPHVTWALDFINRSNVERALESVLLPPKLLAYYLTLSLKSIRDQTPFSRLQAQYPVSKVLKENHEDDDGFFSENDWDYTTMSHADLPFSFQNHTKIAELQSYCPDTFANLRKLFGISTDSFSRSIFGSGPFVSFQSNSKGAARVGGVFFFTRDGAYMIKTIKQEEAKTFLKMLPKYHRHMTKHGRKSLLTRFCGMYTVRIRSSDDKFSSSKDSVQTFVVMNSVFPSELGKFISERYDLKGSTVGREVSDEERLSKGSYAVLKDLDLAREVELTKSMTRQGKQSEQYGFNVGSTAKEALLSQLKHDVRLLIDCQVMDYSLLVGVVNMERNALQQSTNAAISLMREQNRRFEQIEYRKPRRSFLSTMTAPVRLLAIPPTFLARKVASGAKMSLHTICSYPLPYYGSDQCGVDGGALSVLPGTRRGDRAVYYLGLIDFLQPWTTRKVFERYLKGLMGHNKHEISCVDPEEYATRFLEFLEANLS